MAQPGNLQEESKSPTLLTTKKAKYIASRLRLLRPKQKVAGVSLLTIETNYTGNEGTPNLRDVEQKREPEIISMRKIEQWIRIPENLPP